ncbi:hypothetical protein L6452_40606 [Arctium lappa]|uniref:Uncharacterized protein n=1 Tax=Arctium lappa TaxID=4217 RepID=A0ACB8XMX9_ARCLA|nr:hypothetical protein L6452_40606 [Arctium lappa]
MDRQRFWLESIIGAALEQVSCFCAEFSMDNDKKIVGSCIGGAVLVTVGRESGNCYDAEYGVDDAEDGFDDAEYGFGGAEYGFDDAVDGFDDAEDCFNQSNQFIGTRFMIIQSEFVGNCSDCYGLKYIDECHSTAVDVEGKSDVNLGEDLATLISLTYNKKEVVLAFDSVQCNTVEVVDGVSKPVEVFHVE